VLPMLCRFGSQQASTPVTGWRLSPQFAQAASSILMDYLTFPTKRQRKLF
jgi:hypothetical protein